MLKSSRRSPLHYGRLGSLEERLNVSSAPQRGASLHLRRRAGLGVGLKIMIMNKQSFFLVAAVVLLSACGAREETKFLNANPEAVVITSDGKATNGMVCEAHDRWLYLDHILYRISGSSMEVGGCDEEFRNLDDFPLWFRFYRHGERCFFMDEYVMGYRFSDRNLSVNLKSILNKKLVTEDYKMKKKYMFDICPRRVRIDARLKYGVYRIIDLLCFFHFLDLLFVL